MTIIVDTHVRATTTYRDGTASSSEGRVVSYTPPDQYSPVGTVVLDPGGVFAESLTPARDGSTRVWQQVERPAAADEPVTGGGPRG